VRPRSVDRARIEAEINQIRLLGLDALRKRFAAKFGAAPPAGLTKDVIARLIAYQIQEEAYGGHARDIVRLLDRMARSENCEVELSRRLKPGTVLIREYGGERHTVTIVPDGYVWRGTTYGSLSTIARAITGTSWSGPRFFGVRNHDGSEASDQSQRGQARSAAPSNHVHPSRIGSQSSPK
jgi:hypothetical protein